MQDENTRPLADAETPDRSRLALLGALSAGAAGGACTGPGIGRSGAPVVNDDPRFRPIDSGGGDDGGGDSGGGGGSH